MYNILRFTILAIIVMAGPTYGLTCKTYSINDKQIWVSPKNVALYYGSLATYDSAIKLLNLNSFNMASYADFTQLESCVIFSTSYWSSDYISNINYANVVYYDYLTGKRLYNSVRPKTEPHSFVGIRSIEAQQFGNFIFIDDGSVFNNIKLGSQGLKKYLLRNAGNIDENFNAFTSSLDFSIINNNCGSTIKPEQFCSFDVKFTPNVIGYKYSELILNSKTDSLIVNINGSGVTGNLDYKNINIGSSSRISISVTNYSSGTIRVPDAIISGLNISDFHIANDVCSGQLIASGDKCTVDAVFSPKSIGEKKLA